MTKTLRWTLVAALALSGALAGGRAALAGDLTNTNGTNLQDGDNSSKSAQTGNADSGDAVGGQVAGVVSSGDASVDAKNKAEDVDLETGQATGNNTSSTFAGLNSSTTTSIDAAAATDIECDGSPCSGVNLQDGDNELDVSQAASATSGDGVGGEVIGVVTGAGGSADIKADSSSEDIDIETGVADASNDAAAFVGLNTNISETDGLVVSADLTNVDGTNLQDGDNELNGDQSADAASGDGVGGQVLGVVAGGDTKMDAKNRSEDIDLETGTSDASNSVARFAGLNTATSTSIEAADVEDSSGTNLQDGDNDSDWDQSASAASGDAVGGQVAGVVTSAGGTADLTLDNSSEDVDGESGEATQTNDDEGFVGLNFATDTLVI